MYLCYMYFFFFQAEDGIRDVAVTGVQTCALPVPRVRPQGLRDRGRGGRPGFGAHGGGRAKVPAAVPDPGGGRAHEAALSLSGAAVFRAARPPGSGHRADLRVRWSGGVPETASDYCKRGPRSLALSSERPDRSPLPAPRHYRHRPRHRRHAGAAAGAGVARARCPGHLRLIRQYGGGERVPERRRDPASRRQAHDARRGRPAPAQAAARGGARYARRVGPGLRGAAAGRRDPRLREIARSPARRAAGSRHAGYARPGDEPRARAARQSAAGTGQGRAAHRDDRQRRRPGEHDPVFRVQRLVRPRGAGRRAPRRAADRDGGPRRHARNGARPARDDATAARRGTAGALDQRCAPLLHRVPQAAGGAGRLHRERRAADRGAPQARGPRLRGAAAGSGPGGGGAPRPHADRSARRAGERGHAGGRGSGASPPVGARVPPGRGPDGGAGRVPGGGRVTTMPRKVAVIGAGDIGCGWAALCASAGWPVTVFDASAQGLERAAAEVPRRTRALVALERATQGIVERGLVEFTQARSLLQAVQDADWVIEAIPEDAIAKQKLFGSIEQLAGPDTLLTSSSSGIPPAEIFARCRRQDRCLVAHPLNPPELIPLVEVVPAARTSAAAVVRTQEYLRALGRMPILLKKSIPGYVVGRVTAAVWRQCIDLVLEGVIDVDQLDRAVSLGPALGSAAARP